MNQYTHRDALPKNHRVLWYEIQSVLGQGGFGITYLAWDKNLDQSVAIKEYLPSDLSMRDGTGTVRPRTKEEGEAYHWGLAQFLSEARTLSRFRHPNIVRVRTSFEANNTAYMVMDYESGHDLETLFNRGQYREEAALLSIFLPILDGLSLVHNAGFIHRDIKPANIFVRQDSSAVLLDFGSARQAVAERTHIITSLVSPGYAPFEQYDVHNKKQGPWTDIYAVGATLYQAISGNLPPEAVARSNAKIFHEPDPYVPAVTRGAGRYTRQFLSTIDYALRLLPADRPSSVKVLLEALNSNGEIPREQQTNRYQHPVSSAFAPQATSISDLLAQAEEHLGAERLVDPPGHNALECYRQILTLEPQHTDGIQGLTKLRNHYLRLAEQAIGNDQAALARGHLRTADHIQPGTRTFRQMWGRVAESKKKTSRRKRKSRKAIAYRLAIVLVVIGITSFAAMEWLNKRAEQLRIAEKVRQTLVQADADFEAKRYVSPARHNALERYRRVLSLDNDNKMAKQRISELAANYLALAEQAIAHGQMAVAERNLEIVERIRKGEPIPDFPTMPLAPKRKHPSGPNQGKTNRVAELVARADAHFRAGRLTAPKGNNALEGYRTVLQLDPNSSDAAHGISELLRHYVKLADQAIATGRLDIAAKKLNTADDIDPSSSMLKDAWSRLDAATKKTQARAEQQKPRIKSNPVEELLAEARAHIEAQRLIEPPTENALETYQSILALDPNNADAKQGISELQDHYIMMMEKALEKRKIETAKEHLKNVEIVDPGSEKVEQAWRKLMGDPEKDNTTTGSRRLF